jgi:hypothetical protein
MEGLGFFFFLCSGWLQLAVCFLVGGGDEERLDGQVKKIPLPLPF